MGIYGNPWESMGIPGIRPSPGVGNSPPLLAVRTKFDQYYSTVLQYRTAQPLNWFLRYDQSINLLVKSFVSEISDPWKPLLCYLGSQLPQELKKNAKCQVPSAEIVVTLCLASPRVVPSEVARSGYLCMCFLIDGTQAHRRHDVTTNNIRHSRPAGSSD